jgi:hypothetical protein
MRIQNSKKLRRLENFNNLYHNSNNYYSSIPSIICDGTHEGYGKQYHSPAHSTGRFYPSIWLRIYKTQRKSEISLTKSSDTMQWLISVALAVLAVVRKINLKLAAKKIDASL